MIRLQNGPRQSLQMASWMSQVWWVLGPCALAMMEWTMCVCLRVSQIAQEISHRPHPSGHLLGVLGGESRLGDQTSGFSSGSWLSLPEPQLHTSFHSQRYRSLKVWEFLMACGNQSLRAPRTDPARMCETECPCGGHSFPETFSPTLAVTADSPFHPLALL